MEELGLELEMKLVRDLNRIKHEIWELANRAGDENEGTELGTNRWCYKSYEMEWTNEREGI